MSSINEQRSTRHHENKSGCTYHPINKRVLLVNNSNNGNDAEEKPSNDAYDKE